MKHDLVYDWLHIYGNDPPIPNATIFEVPQTQQHIASNAQLYIKDSQFVGSNGDYGGAIYYNSKEGYKALIESSTFQQCKYVANGGAIYNIQAEFVISKCCSSSCYSQDLTLGAQFIYSTTKRSANVKNDILDSAVSFSMPSSSTPTGGNTLSMSNGIIHIDKVNISNNYCKYYTALYVLMESNIAEQQCSIQYSSFNHNLASIDKIIYIESLCTSFIEHSNIILNHDSGTNGLISAESQMSINHCCILNNTANYIFHGNNRILNIIDSTIDQLTYNNVQIDADETVVCSFVNNLRFTQNDEICFSTPDKFFLKTYFQNCKMITYKQWIQLCPSLFLIHMFLKRGNQ